jgi:maleylpyruvate isomerase
MTPDPALPVEDLARVREAEGRLSDSVRSLDDSDVRAPSLLPGWSVGHLLTHLARNADSHRRRTVAAVGGVVVDQYPGGPAARAAEIEAGAGRPAAALVEDVARASARMLDAWTDVPDHAWAGVSRDAGGRERTLAELPGRRWYEVEVHLVDLGTGATHRHWPDPFVAARLGPMRSEAHDRLPEGASLPNRDAFDERDELAWLYGRLARPDLPVLGPWA